MDTSITMWRIATTDQERFETRATELESESQKQIDDEYNSELDDDEEESELDAAFDIYTIPTDPDHVIIGHEHSNQDGYWLTPDGTPIDIFDELNIEYAEVQCIGLMAIARAPYVLGADDFYIIQSGYPDIAHEHHVGDLIPEIPYKYQGW